MLFWYRGGSQFRIDGPTMVLYISCILPCWLDLWLHHALLPPRRISMSPSIYKRSYFGRQQDHFLILMVNKPLS